MRFHKGFTLIGALFIITILALLGVGLMNIHIFRLSQANDELNLAQAQFAARSALALAKASTQNICPHYSYHFDRSFASLSGFTVNVDCRAEQKDSSPTPNLNSTSYEITVTKGKMGTADYVLTHLMVTSNER